MGLHHFQRFVGIGALLCCLFFCAYFPAKAQTYERTVITERFDTVLVRTKSSPLQLGLEAGVGAGWSLGAIEMPASVNNTAVRAAFTNVEFAAVQSWNLSAKASYAAQPDGVRLAVSTGLYRQTALLRYEPSVKEISNVAGNALEYALLQSFQNLSAIRIHAMAEIPQILLPELSATFGVNALWTLGAEAEMLYIRQNAAGTLTPRLALATAAPVWGTHVGLAYNLRSHESSLWGIPLRGRFQPSFSVEWQPTIIASAESAVSNLFWGALTLRLGCAWNIEFVQPDTLSVQPFVRILPIEVLEQTPLSSRLHDEEGAAGRIVAPQELKEAVLEDRIIIYRPDDAALIQGIPSEALDILRNSVVYIRSGARCRLILTIPTKKTFANVPQAESALRVMGDYLLKKGVEVSSIEAGLAENIYNAGDAWQLRIRITRAVR